MTEVSPPTYEIGSSEDFGLDPLNEAVELFQSLRYMKGVKGLSVTIEGEDFTLWLTSGDKAPATNLMTQPKKQ